MTLRRFGILLLFAVGVLPLVVAGGLMVRRAKRTALDEVVEGNRRVARRAATRLSSFVDGQVNLLRTLAIPFAPSVRATPEQRMHVVRSFSIAFPRFGEVAVVGRDGMELATSRPTDELRRRTGERAVDEALAGRTWRSQVELSADLKPLMTVGVPLDVAGEPIGVAVARIDMVDMWDAITEVHVGKTGLARLVTDDNTLIGHGDPEERRRVFLREKDPFADKVRAAGDAGARYRDSQGRDVIAVGAALPNLGWMVIVEQPVAEAFGEANAMQRDLLVVVLLASIAMLVVGLYLGRAPVRALEAMGRHAREVAKGNLAARVGVTPALEELRALARALDEMAAEIQKMQDDMKAKERLSTFARVAAGLAHDLRAPIESVRTAVDTAMRFPDDDGARDLMRSATERDLPRLQKYVRDLQRLAQEGTIPLELASLDPRALVDAIARDAGASEKWDGVSFTVEGQAERVWADESLLERAVRNLVGNAADACAALEAERRHVTLRVSDSSDGRELRIEVEDRGPGMEASRLADVLRSDFRSTKRNSGVGLGLGVVRQIVTAHAGALGAESSPGEGSCFRITIPRSAAAGVSATDGVTRANDRGEPRSDDAP